MILLLKITSFNAKNEFKITTCLFILIKNTAPLYFLKTILMNIKLIAIGKTDNKQLQTLIDDYQKRLSFYVKFDLEIIVDIKNVKNLSELQQKEKEGELILSKITPTDHLILLDENGKNLSSIEFSAELQKKMNSGIKTLIFVIGGPYGFSEMVYQKAQSKISLSKMTFSHQMVRLFFIEQLYRGFTILKNEPYHHQ
jgi:23S rRNA (pseudouridine1915-N3)-methyltransferase